MANSRDPYHPSRIGGPPQIELTTPDKRGGFFPVPVLTALVSMAKANGTPVLVREEAIPVGKSVAIRQVTRVGKPELTPYWAIWHAMDLP